MRALTLTSDRDGLAVRLFSLPFGKGACARSHILDQRADAHVDLDSHRTALDGDRRKTILDRHSANLAREEITLLHTRLSGVPGKFGPSVCEPELPGNEPTIEPAGNLQVNEYSLSYVGFTVNFRRQISGARDRNSNSAVICDGRSSGFAA